MVHQKVSGKILRSGLPNLGPTNHIPPPVCRSSLRRHAEVPPVTIIRMASPVNRAYSVNHVPSLFLFLTGWAAQVPDLPSGQPKYPTFLQPVLTADASRIVPSVTHHGNLLINARLSLLEALRSDKFTSNETPNCSQPRSVKS